jgi:hypothetical protein
VSIYGAFDMGYAYDEPAPAPPPRPVRPVPPQLPVAVLLRASWWRRLVTRLRLNRR